MSTTPVAEMVRRAAAGVEILFGHDTERADSVQRLGYPRRSARRHGRDRRLALFAARRVKIVHQTGARIGTLRDTPYAGRRPPVVPNSAF